MSLFHYPEYRLCPFFTLFLIRIYWRWPFPRKTICSDLHNVQAARVWRWSPTNDSWRADVSGGENNGRTLPVYIEISRVTTLGYISPVFSCLAVNKIEVMFLVVQSARLHLSHNCVRWKMQKQWLHNWQHMQLSLSEKQGYTSEKGAFRMHILPFSVHVYT